MATCNHMPIYDGKRTVNIFRLPTTQNIFAFNREPYQVFLGKYKKAIILAFIVGLFFAIMARVDFVVHAMLYNHGLEFSYDWAYQYWVAYDALFVAFSAMAAVTYWLSSQKTGRDKKIAVALALTINLLTLGGLEDVMYFAWNGNLPPVNEVWWWSPWTNVFGTWNSVMQLTMLATMMAISALAWNLILTEKQKETNQKRVKRYAKLESSALSRSSA